MLRLRNRHNRRRSPRFIPLLKRKSQTTYHLTNVSSRHRRSLRKNAKETTKYKPRSRAPRSLAKSTSDGYTPKTLPFHRKNYFLYRRSSEIKFRKRYLRNGCPSSTVS